MVHQGYLSFLLDLTARGQRVVADSVRYEPTPAQRPGNAFQWKIVVDVEGTVVVRGHAESRYRVLGKATLASAGLTSHRGLGKVPNSFQWKLVEVAVREELARAGERSRANPAWVEQIEVDDLVELRVEDVELDDTVEDPPAPRPRAKSPKSPKPQVTREAGATAGPASRRKPRKSPLLLLAGVAIVVAIVVVAVTTSRSNRSRPAVAPRAATPARTVDAGIARRTPIDAPPPLEQRIASAPDFATALALARPAMDDSPSALSPGAQLLAHYASHQLRWADVGGAAETTIGHVLKDPEIERGKRLCATGTVQAIERRDLERRKIYVGRLTTADDDAIAFVAVGSTTDIVKRSKATICGVVIGRAGGAVSLVGMFDLPENRAPIVERER